MSGDRSWYIFTSRFRLAFSAGFSPLCRFLSQFRSADLLHDTVLFPLVSLHNGVQNMQNVEGTKSQNSTGSNTNETFGFDL